MRSFQHYLPGQLAETTPHQSSSTLFAVSSTTPYSDDGAASRNGAYARPPVPATGSFTPNIDKIWGHTVKRARQGSPLHRQTSRSSTAPTGSQSRPRAAPGAADSQALFTHQSFNTCSCAWSCHVQHTLP